ncbi:phage gp36-like protein [Pseudarthrobacter sp. W1I19]|uniref:phage protein Gp36 family protein n=1 Tax=Pseudarthrobacter sp. W1I19 TaxID=3042288 RepID=UPI00278593BF|nr:phage protein Gp36 family protein [Pseudarthrobacter sp. W1I19]MDQ0923341.1 phage gp36-like protein [Pseudarthrobacter sp. W1I19]
MSTTLQADSFAPANIKERAVLDADVAVAATSLTLKSNQGLAVGDFLYLGALNQEGCEKGVIQSLSGATGVTLIAGVGFAHKRFEPVTAVLGDQVHFYRAANVDGTVPADSAFAGILTPADIDPDQPSTYRVDSTGGSGYWYKVTYYSSTAAADATDLAAATAVRGADYAHYASLNEIRGRAGFGKNLNLLDSTIDSCRRAAESEINGALAGKYTIPFDKPVPELIRHIATDLAAGFLLLDQYGTLSDGSTKDGAARVKDARAQLLQIQTGATSVVTVDGSSLAQATTSASSNLYDETTDSGITGGDDERIFRMSDLGSRF